MLAAFIASRRATEQILGTLPSDAWCKLYMRNPAHTFMRDLARMKAWAGILPVWEFARLVVQPGIFSIVLLLS